jgi:hypothetical protein
MPFAYDDFGPYYTLPDALYPILAANCRIFFSFIGVIQYNQSNATNTFANKAASAAVLQG